ncbi:MAG: hypothetical protein AB7T38_07235 [Nitrospirales bacterium]
MQFTEIEREVLGLWITTRALDAMVNHILLNLVGPDPKEVHFETMVHQQLFNVLLLDFLEDVSKNLTSLKGSCVDLLEEICRLSSFNDSDSINFIQEPLHKLKIWLETVITVETYFPSISRTISLGIKRKNCLYICGNISKHNISRLTGAGKRLSEVLKENEVNVDSNSNKILHLLDDFYKRFHEDIFEYQATVITELLNNVRWGIHNYLYPEYLKAKNQDSDDLTKYSYKFPQGISDDFVKTCYLDLMSLVRRKPNMEPFLADSSWKAHY